MLFAYNNSFSACFWNPSLVHGRGNGPYGWGEKLSTIHRVCRKLPSGLKHGFPLKIKGKSGMIKSTVERMESFPQKVFHSLPWVFFPDLFFFFAFYVYTIQNRVY